MKALIPLLILLILPLTPLLAVGIATVTALDGDLSVVRQGITLSLDQISEGFELEEFDLLATNGQSRAEIRFYPEAGLGGTVGIEPGTVVCLATSPRRVEPKIALELFSGTLKCRFPPLAGRADLAIQTLALQIGPSAVSRVQATQCRITLAPTGDCLVTTEAGKLQCQSADGMAFAEPGAAVSGLILEKRLQTTAVNVSTLRAFEGQWLGQRQTVLADQSTALIRFHAGRYQQALGAFQRAWDRFQREGVTLANLWKKQSLQGSLSPAPSLSLEKKALFSLVANLRNTAALLDQTRPILRAIQDFGMAGKLPQALELSRGYRLGAFFTQLDADATETTARLAEVRTLARLYSERNAGQLPEANFLTDLTPNSDFFN